MSPLVFCKNAALQASEVLKSQWLCGFHVSFWQGNVLMPRMQPRQEHFLVLLLGGAQGHAPFAFWPWCSIPVTGGGFTIKLIKTCFKEPHSQGALLRLSEGPWQCIYMIMYFNHDQWGLLSPLWFHLMFSGFGVYWHFGNHTIWKLSGGNV